MEQNRILGDTDLGEVAEAAPPTSDGSEGKWVVWFAGVGGFGFGLGLGFGVARVLLEGQTVPDQ